MSSLLRTPLFDWHVAHGGRIVEFGGWEMPVQYTGIVDEHLAVRQAAGLFDISHMGRLRFTGPQAAAFLNHILTNDVSRLKSGQVRYALVCNDAGGVLDDVLVYRLAEVYWLVVNAANREKIVNWLTTRRANWEVHIADTTAATGMLALQGPATPRVLPPADAAVWSQLKYYAVAEGCSLAEPALLSRTGYTGEDGCELIVPREQLLGVWEALLARGRELGVRPCGLGARDTLRLEAAMPLYGHELTERIDPLTAGLAFAVKLDKPDFVGKAALLQIAQQTDRPQRVGLKLAGRRVAREGCRVYAGDTAVGEVTSGTFSPTLQMPIAMAYLAPSQATAGTSVDIDIRGKREPATVVPLPFYKRSPA
jgi:aminomethyltransferase